MPLRKGALWASIIALIVVAPLTAHAAPASAQRASVTLTRKQKNLYKVDGQPFWIRTRYCYEYGYGEDAALSDYEVLFIDSGAKCDVRDILKETVVRTGTYRVNATQEEDDLYSTFDGVFIRTSMCLQLAVGEEAILKVDGYNSALVFPSGGTRCAVENLYSKVRL